MSQTGDLDLEPGAAVVGIAQYECRAQSPGYTLHVASNYDLIRVIEGSGMMIDGNAAFPIESGATVKSVSRSYQLVPTTTSDLNVMVFSVATTKPWSEDARS